jgi:hypothetical protein
MNIPIRVTLFCGQCYRWRIYTENTRKKMPVIVAFRGLTDVSVPSTAKPHPKAALGPFQDFVGQRSHVLSLCRIAVVCATQFEISIHSLFRVVCGCTFVVEPSNKQRLHS